MFPPNLVILRGSKTAMKIQAAVLERRGLLGHGRKIAIEEVELDDPNPDEVRVKVTSCGVCGTDREVLGAEVPMQTPCVCGHEGAGFVEAVGREVKSVREGDRVVIGFPWCGECRNCLRGEPRFCLNLPLLMFRGSRLDGSIAMRRPNGETISSHFFQQSSWATHALAPERSLIKVPDGMDHDLFGPLGCSISTGAGTVFNLLKPWEGSSIAIFGAGSVGLSAVMAAKECGCATIVAVDKVPSRLVLAQQLGATHVVNTAHEEPQIAIKELTKNLLDFSMDCTFGAPLAPQAVGALGILGVCALVGGGSALHPLKVNHMDVLMGKRIVGSMGGGGTTPESHLRLMELHAAGRFPLERLIKEYAFEDIEQAVSDSEEGSTVKPLLRMP